MFVQQKDTCEKLTIDKDSIYEQCSSTLNKIISDQKHKIVELKSRIELLSVENHKLQRDVDTNSKEKLELLEQNFKLNQDYINKTENRKESIKINPSFEYYHFQEYKNPNNIDGHPKTTTSTTVNESFILTFSNKNNTDFVFENSESATKSKNSSSIQKGNDLDIDIDIKINKIKTFNFD